MAFKTVMNTEQLMELSLPMPGSEPVRAEDPAIGRARELVLLHGWNSTSFQIVNPGIKRWFSAAGDAVVGYVTAKRTRVVAGAPVCEAERLAAVCTEFESGASRDGQRVCYFCAEQRIESIYSGSDAYSKILLGAQPVWQPVEWPNVITKNRSLRAQLNRARNKGSVVTEWSQERAYRNPQLAECLRQWLESKGLPPLHFIVESDTLARLENRRVFVAEVGGLVTGFIVLSPVAKRNGWLFEQFPHRPGAPNGTVELMIDTAMRSIADEGAEYATLGLSPLSKRAGVESNERDPMWLRLLLAWLRKHGQRFYNFDGLDSFKAKLKPGHWEAVYAVSNEPHISLRTLSAIAGAFSGNATGKLVVGGLIKAAMTEMKWLKRRIAS